MPTIDELLDWQLKMSSWRGNILLSSNLGTAFPNSKIEKRYQFILSFRPVVFMNMESQWKLGKEPVKGKEVEEGSTYSLDVYSEMRLTMWSWGSRCCWRDSWQKCGDGPESREVRRVPVHKPKPSRASNRSKDKEIRSTTGTKEIQKGDSSLRGLWRLSRTRGFRASFSQFL